jgi:hypothetical protein
MTPSVETSYRVSERVLLTPGDQFKVAAGPYYRSADGTKTPMAARGTMTFIAAHRRGQRVVIEASDGSGTVMLHVAGRRRSPVAGLVARPYRITRKLRKRLQA